MGLLQGGQRGEVCCGAFAAETDVGAERVLNGEPGRQAGSLPDMRDQGGGPVPKASDQDCRALLAEKGRQTLTESAPVQCA